MSRSGDLFVDSFLEQLANRLQVYDADIVTGDEMRDWPDGKLNELVVAGILTEIEPANGIVCDECEENCYIEPDIRAIPDTGTTIGVFVCPQNPDIGRFEVDLSRLRQWRINKDKLETLGLLKKNVKKRMRKISSELTKRENEAYQLVHIGGKTPKQAAIEMRCSPQNISNLLKKAEAKVNARQSRSVNLAKAYPLPKDRRGQTNISNEDI